MDADTIVAPATAAGRAAIGVLRVSGPRAAAVCRALTGREPPPPRLASLRRLAEPASGEVVDRGLVIWFPAPGSYTGEDLLEIQHHGGSAVAAALLSACLASPGVRPALPGELTRRSFLAGRLDLTQVEAVADLIDATSRAQARQAMRQLDGELGRRCESWRTALLDALAVVEAEIDFGPDQDLPADLVDSLAASVAAVRDGMARAVATARSGERLREGLVVAVTGAPNAGKSTLVNRLAGRDVAIVTAVPGTTRDVIEVAIELAGLPVVLLDTAGLRDTTDPVEAEGVARARRRAATADLRLLLIAPGEPVPEPDDGSLVVRSKADLAVGPAGSGPLAISALTGTGIEALLDEVAGRLRAIAGEGTAAVTRERHRLALMDATAALERFLAGRRDLELALLGEELRLAVEAIGRVTGRVGVEEVLDRIFARFCIGK
ncbi:MAG TPA: tRNA uridine-5-carboxymethylaminomethyl(34) synthesis GTPase MnmE [Geminicoccaceae bacterium]|nr:tRNA uridine-5-carboxymethylaminomethyl(34) synthesis GTPase MnmE [Geminicoccaceae bacterium]